MSFTASAMEKAVRAYLGYNEHDHGGKTKFGIWYGDRVKNSAFDAAAWCDMFLCFCAHEVAGEDGLKRAGFYAYTPHHAAWFARNGRWGNTPTYGSFGFIDWAGSKNLGAIDHVGFVVGTDKKGRVIMIEGNTSDEVQLRYRDRSLFVGFGYPKYAKPVSAPAKDKPAPTVKKKPAKGSTAPKFPLPAGAWFSKENRNGFASTKDRAGIRRFQARLRERGWRIDVDGLFGDQTKSVVRAFQAEKGLEVDGRVGKITWAAIWNAPIT